MQIQQETVSFTEFLKQLPPAWVIDHFFTGSDEKRKILSSAMIEEIAEKSADPNELIRRFDALSGEQQQRCAVLYLCGSMGCTATSTGGLDDPVVAAFLGYAARGPAGEVRIFGFSEFAPLLRERCAEVLGQATVSRKGIHPAPSWQWRSTNDVAVIIALAGKNLLVKKRSGKFGVVLLQQIKKLIHKADFYKNDDLDVVVKAVCNYCVARELFSEEEEQFICHGGAVAEWFAKPCEERADDVVSWLVRYCGGWDIDLLRQLCGDTGERWLPNTIFPEADRGFVREALAVLRFTGILGVRKQGNDLVFTLAPQVVPGDSPDAHQIVIMPDFTIIMPQESLPVTVYDATRFCRLDTLDKVYHGAVDKTILTEALAGGMRGERMLAQLESWNAPENVLTSVREWIREFFRVTLSESPLLITSEERITEQIAAYPQLADYLERIPAHAVFRLKPGTQRQVTDLVRQLGFDERMPRPLAEQKEEGTAFSLPFMQEPQRQWQLITDSTPQEGAAVPTFRGSKYGTGLKELDMSETVQVIDYAILTGQMLTFTYEGSPYVRKGRYTVTPVICSKGGAEPLLDGQLQRLGTRKQFYIKKISSIGVVAK